MIKLESGFEIELMDLKSLIISLSEMLKTNIEICGSYVGPC